MVPLILFIFFVKLTKRFFNTGLHLKLTMHLYGFEVSTTRRFLVRGHSVDLTDARRPYGHLAAIVQ